MGTVPSLPTFTAGQVLTAAQLTQIIDAVNFWAKPPRCSVYRSAALNHTSSASYVSVAFDAELYDDPQSGDSPMHDTSTNPSRVYVRTTGRYEVHGAIDFDTSGTGQRAVRVIKNGSTAAELAYGNAEARSLGPTFVQTPVVELSLTAGDYLELQGYQSSGGTLAYTVSDSSKNFLRVKFVAET